MLTAAVNIKEMLLISLIPLLEQALVGSLPEAGKPILYTGVAMFGSELREYFKKTRTGIDNAAWANLMEMAKEHMDQAGFPALFDHLDTYVHVQG